MLSRSKARIKSRGKIQNGWNGGVHVIRTDRISKHLALQTFPSAKIFVIETTIGAGPSPSEKDEPTFRQEQMYKDDARLDYGGRNIRALPDAQIRRSIPSMPQSEAFGQ